jgi:hypothetical protein
MTRRRLATAVAAAMIAFAIAGGLGSAANPGDGGLIQGCYDSGGNVKVVAALPCPKGYTALAWNEQGVKGEKGDKGDKGEAGVAGASGKDGANGKDGADGEDGVGVTSEVEPAADNCAHGGSKFTTAGGVAYACNGAPGRKGDTGAPGPAGPPGPAGQSATGVDGLWGESNATNVDWSGGGFIGWHGYGLESDQSYVVPFSATYVTFDCAQSGGSAGTTATLWVRINGLDVSNPCVIEGTATSASVAGSYPVMLGDRVSVRALADSSSGRGLAWRLH